MAGAGDVPENRILQEDILSKSEKSKARTPDQNYHEYTREQRMVKDVLDFRKLWQEYNNGTNNTYLDEFTSVWNEYYNAGGGKLRTRSHRAATHADPIGDDDDEFEVAMGEEVVSGDEPRNEEEALTNEWKYMLHIKEEPADGAREPTPEEEEVMEVTDDDETEDVEELQPILPERKKVSVNHYRNMGAYSQNPSIPAGHDLTHSPPHEKCPYCMMAFFQKSPARTGTPGEGTLAKITKYLDLVYLDTLTIRTICVRGNKYWLSTRDQASKFPRGRGQVDKEPTTTWITFHAMYPGTRTDVPCRLPLHVSCDRGEEYGPEFQEQVKKCGGDSKFGLKMRSQTRRCRTWSTVGPEKHGSCPSTSRDAPGILGLGRRDDEQEHRVH